MLTDSLIRAAKCPADKKQFKLFDEHGLYLLVVNKNNSKLWRQKFYFQGNSHGLTHGKWPAVSLKRARERCESARALLAEGIDPRERRDAEKVARRDTFEVIALEFIASKAKSIEPVVAGKHISRLKRLVFPKLGKRAIATITPQELLAVLRAVEANGHHVSANDTRALCGRIFRYAIATGRAQHDITADLKGALTAPTVKNFAAITEPRQIGGLLRAIDGYDGQPATLLALKIAPYVMLRPGELRMAQWTDVDMQAAEMRFPASRMKMDREHVVPLSTQVLALLEELKEHTGTGKYLFPSLRGARPISNNTLTGALRRLGYAADEMTMHGFRTMASTQLNERGFNPDAIELQLAHVQGKVRATYNKSLLLPERKKMLQAWADYLDELRTGAQVLPLRAAG